MKTKWIEKEFLYDGSQLRSQFAYLEHGLLGNSIVCWRGPCDVSQANMADGEDLLQGAKICGFHMLHFILEIFDQKLFSAVLIQRLMATVIRDHVYKLNPKLEGSLQRDGDDLFWNGGKLSISVAAQSPISCVVHFAINISNEGTPVKTASLKDLGVSPEALAQSVMESIQKEMASIYEATWKVLPIN